MQHKRRALTGNGGYFPQYKIYSLSRLTLLTQSSSLRTHKQGTGFPSVKLSPSLLPNLIATSHISLSSKQLRHNVPIRGNYPHSANCCVILLHFRSNRIQMFAFCRSSMRTKKATALTYQDFIHTSKEQNLKT